MEYRILGKTGLKVSAIVYGGIVSSGRYGGKEYPQWGQEASDRYVSWALDRGVNYFDVAPGYGDAQEQLGVSLAPYRDRVNLACKTEKRDYEGAKADLERSLRLLKTDHFDVYQFHAIVTPEDVDRIFAPGGAMELMLEAKEKGIARHIGFTAHSEEQALRMLDLYDGFESVLFPYNWFLNRAHGMGSRLIAVLKERGIGALSMKSFVERSWSVEERYASRFPKSWCKPIDPETDPDWVVAAMKYALSLGVDTLVPPGNFDCFSFAVEHIDECLAHPLTEEDQAFLDRKLQTVLGREFFSDGVSIKK